MQKLSKEQGDWLIEKIRNEEAKYSLGCQKCNARLSIKSVVHIINQSIEKEFPAFSFETQGHRIISMHQVVNRAALNNEFFLDKAELMHLVIGIEKIIDWMEENE